ncbi:hypothetical protein [Streptomyces sp. NPDC126514]|uniref:hypothetical protein n=1 Tax=Streptomyces sp. NPDC126514 TaxID=3155210 RepID=UPI003332166B
MPSTAPATKPTSPPESSGAWSGSWQSTATTVDDPDTRTARHDLAYWWGEAGDAAGAATAFAELLVDQLRVLGPDHPATLVTNGYFARWLGQADGVSGGVR